MHDKNIVDDPLVFNFCSISSVLDTGHYVFFFKKRQVLNCRVNNNHK